MAYKYVKNVTRRPISLSDITTNGITINPGATVDLLLQATSSQITASQDLEISIKAGLLIALNNHQDKIDNTVKAYGYMQGTVVDDLLISPTPAPSTEASKITFTLSAYTDNKVWIQVPTGNITDISITGNTIGNAVVDLWKSNIFPPSVINTITNGSPPSLVNQQSNADIVLSGWTKTLANGEWLLANVNSVSSLDLIVLVINFIRNI